MSGNMARWSNDGFLDSASQYSTAYSDVSADDRIRSPDIGQRLRRLFDEKLYTDVKFVISCGIKPKPIILAHKAILAIGSEKFREILFETDQPSDEIQINSVSFDAFRNVVEYLYTDDVLFENDQSVLETLSAANKFQIQSLVNKCESYIESVELTEDNVCSKFHLAIDHKLESLKGRCVEFIQDNTGPVLRSSDFLAANTSTVRSICKMEKFNLRSEIELLAGIVRWAEARCDSTSNKRTLVEPFLKHLRLLNVTPEEFNQFVQRNKDLFTAPETANVLVSIANPQIKNIILPSWCKRGKNRCTYHILQTPPQARGARGHVVPPRKLFIFLKPTTLNSYLKNIVCVLELKCIRGKQYIDGLKLNFDDPVDERSVINHLAIAMDLKPSTFHHEELVKIQNSKEVEMKFTKQITICRGDTLTIRAEAQNVLNYKFLQYDDSREYSINSPFEITLGSVPKHNRLFFISEVIYQYAPPSASRGRRSKFR